MSDEWDFYFLRVDDQPASIFVDLGIVSEAPIAALPFMAHIRVYLRTPRPDGFPGDADFDVLEAIERAIERDLGPAGDARYVGRNTGDGVRDFYFYAARSQGWDARAKALMEPFAGYEFECGCRADPEWKTYFEFLYPSDVQRRQISNRHVCETLRKNGDLLAEGREIDHWAYFPNPGARSQFIAHASRLGFQLRAMREPDSPGEPYGVQLFRTDAPDAIDDVTLSLLQLATALGGDYDGWETVLVR